ncbi:MAG: DUF1801 domain-containing protein [Flavobacteriaceae bacterium]|nr:DUF1801 domain-containing protein [Flavobacteriaceae bacterium]
MVNNKTIPNKNDVVIFLDKIVDEQKRNDAFELLKIMKKIKKNPKMWGVSIVGFGEYHYKYDSGREGDMFLSGFSPRKQNLKIYIMSGVERYDKISQNIGKHKLGKSCFYIKKLEDINKDLLEEMIVNSVNKIKRKYS